MFILTTWLPDHLHLPIYVSDSRILYAMGGKSVWLMQGWAKNEQTLLVKTERISSSAQPAPVITEGHKTRGSSQAWNKFHNSALSLSLDKSLVTCKAMPQVCHITMFTFLQIVPNNQTERKRSNIKQGLHLLKIVLCILSLLPFL